MKTLVGIDRQGQGRRDFTYTTPGEPVTFGMVCCNAATCGCDRSFVGVFSRKATTHAVVADVEVDDMAVRAASLKAWPGSEEIADGTVQQIKDLADAVAAYPVGMVFTVRHGARSSRLYEERRVGQRQGRARRGA